MDVIAVPGLEPFPLVGWQWGSAIFADLHMGQILFSASLTIAHIVSPFLFFLSIIPLRVTIVNRKYVRQASIACPVPYTVRTTRGRRGALSQPPWLLDSIWITLYISMWPLEIHSFGMMCSISCPTVVCAGIRRICRSRKEKFRIIFPVGHKLCPKEVIP